VGSTKNNFDDTLTVATTNAVVVRHYPDWINNPLSGGVGAPLITTYNVIEPNCANGPTRDDRQRTGYGLQAQQCQ